jgi:hypothetical protein
MKDLPQDKVVRLFFHATSPELDLGVPYSHEQHVFAIDLEIELLQLVGDPAVAVRWRFRRDLLNVLFP